MSLTIISLSRRVTTFMFFSGVALLAVITFTQIGVDFLPKILVETDLSGAPPEGIEKSVTRPVEGVVSTVDGVKSVTSASQDDKSLVTISSYWETSVGVFTTR
ncbi:MAG: efflux RND transporter permease subunit [Candidatus Kryptoniota bacterium]